MNSAQRINEVFGFENRSNCKKKKATFTDSQVVLTKVDGHSLYHAIETVIDICGGLPLKQGGRVVIKINLSCSRPWETGATSDPRVVRELTKLIIDRYNTSDITLVESDSSQEKVEILYRWLGFKDVFQDLNVQFVNLSKNAFTEKAIDGCHFRKVKVPSTISEADCFISLPKLKTHSDVKLSCVLKNQFGCYPYPRKIRYHPFLHEAIVDANLAMRPHFSLVDGIIAMQGSGPTYGIPIKLNVLIGSYDPVAADTISAKILGIPPFLVKYLRMAAKKNLGTMHYQLRTIAVDEIPRLQFYTFDHMVHKLVNLLTQARALGL